MKPTGSNTGSSCCHKSDYRIVDTWNATGLRGTGSNDVEVDDAFVAEPMTVAVSDLAGGPTPGSAVNPNALYALPVFSLFPYVLSGVALGNAQACLDDYVDVARHRASTYNRAKLGDLQSTQIKIAEASAKIDAARLIMRSTCIEAMADAQARPRSGYRRQDQVAPRRRFFRQPLHRSGVAVVCGERRAGICPRRARCSGSFATPTRSIRTSRSISMRPAPITAGSRSACLPKT